MVSILRLTSVLLTFTFNTILTAQQDGSVTTTRPGLAVNITIPHEAPDTYNIYFWTHHPNTNISIRFTSHLNYLAKFTINQPDVWHVGYLSQPMAQRAVSITIPHGNIYTNLDNTSVKQVTLTSENLVYWAFCKNRGVCALVIPDNSLPSNSRSADNGTSACSTSTTSSRSQYLLVGLGLVCFLLVVAVVVLSCYLCCRRKSELFHVYEKPFHPPLPPPMVPRIVIQSENDSRDTHDTSVIDSDDGDGEAPYDLPYDELQHHPINLHLQHQHDRRLQQKDLQDLHHENHQLRQRERQLSQHAKTQHIDVSNQHDSNQKISTSNRNFNQHNSHQKIDASNRDLNQHDSSQKIDASSHDVNQHNNQQKVDTGDTESLNSLYCVILK